ncbi:hypothetical protein [Nonomuraea sp. NPDC002799]
MTPTSARGSRSTWTPAYRITDAGLAEVRRWLAEDDVDHTLRSESVLRSFFFWLMEPEELLAHLQREQQQFFTEVAAMSRACAAAKDRGDFGTSAPTRSMRVAPEAAVRFYDALADWAEWAQTVPPAIPAEEEGPEAGQLPQ